MLTIIISSYQSHLYERIEENIKLTCDVEYEILKIDNPGLMGISEAYNIGGRSAKNAYLLFIHEDILFRTSNWGSKLIKHLNVKNVGVIGVAGSSYIPHVPSNWFLTDCEFIHASFIQNDKLGKQYSERRLNIYENKTKVFKLDGMFLAVRKDVFNGFQFNEKLKGFHGYDTDFSLRVSKRYNNYVIDDIIIEHFSEGNSSFGEWINSHIYILKNTEHPCKEIYDEKLEREMFIFFTRNCLNHYNYSFLSFLKSFKFLSPNLSFKSYIKILKFYIRSLQKKMKL